MKRQHVIVVGATSAIARATARLYAAEGAAIALLARDQSKLAMTADDLRARGAGHVTIFEFEASAWPRFEALFGAVERALGPADVVLVAHGTLPDQAACADDPAAMRQAVEINGLSVMTLLTVLAGRLERQGYGTLAVISSVAGDRGRQSNYVYGAAKAGLNAFLQGLRARLQSKGVNVLTIKPGFVDTPMTASFDKGALWTLPETVARGIHKSIAKGKGEVYLPGFWRWIMLVLRLLPECMFLRLKL